jgi:hypothetical protein
MEMLFMLLNLNEAYEVRKVQSASTNPGLPSPVTFKRCTSKTNKNVTQNDLLDCSY